MTMVGAQGRAASSPDFGTLLRRHRLAAGLSQEALAERARMSTNGISGLERGYRRTPQRETLALLVTALQLDDEQRCELESAARGFRRSSAAPWSEATSYLPIALTSFIGRETELDEIARLVRAHRMVTITGAGGIGKTQTALQVATGLGDAVDGAVWFVPLATTVNPSLVVAAIASTLGVHEVPNRPLLETLVAYLKSKALLLILDGCEHVIAMAASVAETLLAGCARIRILAASREPLRVAGEHTYRLPSLRFATREAARRIGAAEAAGFAAIALFTDRARAADHRFALTDENAPVVAEICRQLDGIPLAIELAAARVNLLSVGTIAKKLGDRFMILCGGERTALARQQTMRAAIDWSYDLLSPAERRFFERLSVFAGGCTLGSATSVCSYDEIAEGDVLDLLSTLVDKSLIVADFDGAEPRYRLFESFREYAREKLEARGEGETVAHRHALACLQLTERLEHAYGCESDGVWRALAQEELDNWRTALQRGLTERRDVVLAQELVGALHMVWRHFACLEGRQWIASALELVDERTPASVVAGLHCAEGLIALELGEVNVMLASSESALASYAGDFDSLGIVRAQRVKGLALANLGRLAEAKALLGESLAGARRLDNRRLTALALHCLANVSKRNGDLSAARSYITEAMSIWEGIGGTLFTAAAFNELAECEFQAGNTELALAHAIHALETNRALNVMSSAAMPLNNLSAYLVSLGRYDEAEERAREALDLAREHLQESLVTWALQHLGAIAALRSQLVAESVPAAATRAARILGFVNARITATGSARQYTEAQEYDRVLAALQDAMGAQAVAELMAEGAAMTEDRAVEEALTPAAFLS
jgi:predicted ATPase